MISGRISTHSHVAPGKILPAHGVEWRDSRYSGVGSDAVVPHKCISWRDRCRNRPASKVEAGLGLGITAAPSMVVGVHRSTVAATRRSRSRPICAASLSQERDQHQSRGQPIRVVLLGGRFRFRKSTTEGRTSVRKGAESKREQQRERSGASWRKRWILALLERRLVQPCDLIVAEQQHLRLTRSNGLPTCDSKKRTFPRIKLAARQVKLVTLTAFSPLA